MAQSQQSTSSGKSRSGAAAGAPADKGRSDVTKGPGSQSSKNGELTGQAKEAVNQAQEQASNLVGQAKQQATTQLASQKERAASAVGVLASALHEASRQVREQDDATMAGYIDSAASQLETLADTLGQQDIGQILDSAGRYARRQPAVFLAGAVALGFLGARFLKSSSQGASRGTDRSGYGSSSGRSAAYGADFGAGYAGGGLDRGGYGGARAGAEGGLGYGSSSGGVGASSSGVGSSAGGMGLSDSSRTTGSGAATGSDWQARSAFDTGPEGS